MYVSQNSRARGTPMTTVVKLGMAVILNSTAITLLTAAFLQVDYDVPLWRAIDANDVYILVRTWLVSVVLCLGASCVLWRSSVCVSVATAWAFGCIFGVLISQLYFPGRTYLGNAVHFTCITVPVTVACSTSSSVIVFLFNQNHRRSHPQTKAH